MGPILTAAVVTYLIVGALIIAGAALTIQDRPSFRPRRPAWFFTPLAYVLGSLLIIPVMLALLFMRIGAEAAR